MAIAKTAQLPIGTVVRVGDRYGYVWHVGMHKVRGKPHPELLHKILFTHRKHYFVTRGYKKRATYTIIPMQRHMIVSVRPKDLSPLEPSETPDNMQKGGEDGAS